jgi:SPP1 gp7 family putative phage head morphogenesis protein
MQVERTTGLSRHIAAEIARGGEVAAEMIRGEMLNVYGLNLDWARYGIDRQAGFFLDWTVYDRRQIGVLVSEGQSPFTRIAYNRLGQDKRIVTKLQNEMLQAILLGESQAQIMRRIRDVTGQSVAQARRVAQTERNRVQSEARYQGIKEAADMGIQIMKRWISRMDSRVRDDHADVTGEEVDYEKPFSNGLMFPGDPDGSAEEVINCRCVLQPMVKYVPESVKRYREEMRQDWGFDEYRQEGRRSG